MEWCRRRYGGLSAAGELVDGDRGDRASCAAVKRPINGMHLPLYRRSDDDLDVSWFARLSTANEPDRTRRLLGLNNTAGQKLADKHRQAPASSRALLIREVAGFRWIPLATTLALEREPLRPASLSHL